MPERQTNLRIDSREENIWIEHYVHDNSGEEYEESERVTVKFTHNVALDALSLYNELMRTIPRLTLQDLKDDIQRLEEIGYDEWNEEDTVRRVEEKERGDDKDDSEDAAVVAR